MEPDYKSKSSTIFGLTKRSEIERRSGIANDWNTAACAVYMNRTEVPQSKCLNTRGGHRRYVFRRIYPRQISSLKQSQRAEKYAQRRKEVSQCRGIAKYFAYSPAASRQELGHYLQTSNASADGNNKDIGNEWKPTDASASSLRTYLRRPSP